MLVLCHVILVLCCVHPLQEFNKEAFLECIKDLIRLDKEWIPTFDNCSLYIRPTFIGTEVGVVLCLSSHWLHVLIALFRSIVVGLFFCCFSLFIFIVCCFVFFWFIFPSSCPISSPPPPRVLVQPTVGVSKSCSALLYCLLSPVGPYFSTGSFNAVSLYADPMFVRAWPGGFGDTKVGG